MYQYCQRMLFTQTFKRMSHFFTVGIDQQSRMSVMSIILVLFKLCFFIHYGGIKIMAFWGLMPCSLVDGNQCFGRTCPLHFRVEVNLFYPKMEAADSSDSFVYIYQIIRHHVVEDCNLDT